AVQNRWYTTDDGKPGGTSAGDVVLNHAETLMTTTPTDETAGVQNSHGIGVGGEMKAYDDSAVEVQADESSLKKYVLPRNEAAVDAGEIADVEASVWEDEQAKEPFIAGDQTWYK